MELKPGYKQTAIGILPSSWEVLSLAAVSENIMVGIASAATHAYRSKGIPLVRNQNIKAGWLDDGELLFIDPEYENTFRNKRLNVGDLLTARTGYPGVTCVVPPKYRFAQSFTTLITRPKKDRIDSTFLCHFINSTSGQLFFERSQIGGAQKNVNVATLRDMPVPLPSPVEQHAIANALSDADELISCLDRLIAEKHDLKQAAMQQLLTGKTRLPGFSGEWEVKTIEELEKSGDVKLSRGKVISKNDIGKVVGHYPIYSSSIHNDGEFGRYGLYMFDEELVTWSVDGGGNFFYRAKHKFSVTNVCGYMRVNAERLSYRFLAYQLQFLHSRLFFDYTLKAHPSVIRRAYSLKLPDLDEQRAIASVLSDMDLELDELGQEGDKYTLLKQGMMQELLTGKTRLI